MATSAYALGLFFIVLVALIWAASSVLVQFLYSDAVSFDSPFLLTYIGVSLFTLWLPTNLIWTSACVEKVQSTSVSNGFELSPSSSSAAAYQTVPTTNDGDDNTDDNDDDVSETEHNGSPGETIWTHAQHRQAALMIAPVWFMANWSYNASLAYTSITSSTVLASTGSLFTFLFAVCSKDETFNWMKLAGVLLGVTGSILTAWQDRGTADVDDAPDHVLATCIDPSSCVPQVPTLLTESQTSRGAALFGDVLGLLSAVGYGAYAVQTRLLCPHNEELYSMEVLLGYIGLFNMVALSPIVAYQLLSSGGSGDNLTWLVFGFLVVKGLFDNVLSDYLWLRAVILTNATVATVGLGLTIPLAFASDVVLGKAHHVLSAGSIFGALAVLLGFSLVNIGNTEKNPSEEAVTTAEDDEEEANPFHDEQALRL